jgi:hypothetical protein
MKRMLALALLIATPALAGQPSPAPKAHKNPYATLFQGDAPPVKALKPSPPKVVCGMTMIAGDPNVDPAMAKTRDPNDKTHYTMRVVPPPICKP